MKKVKTIVLLVVLIFCRNVYPNDCIITDDNLEYWNGVFDKLKENYNAVEIKGKKKELLIKYSKYINEIIIKKDIKKLLDNIRSSDFRYYSPVEDKSDNIASKIIKDLKAETGFYYYFIFDKKKLTKGYKWSNPYAKDIDIQYFLKNCSKHLIWKVFFNPKEKVYEIWFSIPDYLIIDFDYFHYVVKQENNKFILVGF